VINPLINKDTCTGSIVDPAMLPLSLLRKQRYTEFKFTEFSFRKITQISCFTRNAPSGLVLGQ